MIMRTITHLLPVERRQGVPLYHQIQQRLMEEIRSGLLRQNDPLPPVREIAARFHVSQMTARQAIRSLCDLGVIYSRQGKGTFISRTKLEKDFRQVLSFTEEMRMRGVRPASRLLSFRLQNPGGEIRKSLELRANEKVFRLRRLRLADGVPMGIECSSLPAQLCPNLLHTFNPDSSLYQALAEFYGIQLMTASEAVEVGRATAEEARLLRIAPKSPVFLITRLSFLENGRPAEHVRSTYRGDRYKIVNRLTRPRSELPPSSL
jgi:GntR family transcriptional regulator